MEPDIRYIVKGIISMGWFVYSFTGLSRAEVVLSSQKDKGLNKVSSYRILYTKMCKQRLIFIFLQAIENYKFINILE